MNFLKLALASLVCMVAAASTPAQAAESPLSCKVFDQEITCAVQADTVDIRDVKFNRGNCNALLPLSKQERSTFEELLANASPLDREMANSELFISHIEPVPKRYTDLIYYKNYTKEPHYKLIVALIALAYSPLGKYKFGDEVKLQLGNCKLLEYSIETDAGEWTFKTR